jgi:hypothetical protein
MNFSASEWKLVGNSGREQFFGSFLKRGSNEDGLELILANVSVVGDFWLDPPFALGVREDLICSLKMPACTISYCSNSFEVGKWHFVVDQSCIRIFREELRAALDSLYSTPSR